MVVVLVVVVVVVCQSGDVKATSGFCTSYCGWHTHGTYSGVDIKCAAHARMASVEFIGCRYSFVGNPEQQCMTGCAGQQTISPNGNPGADALISVVAHELFEAFTDPDLNAVYDGVGCENGDRVCDIRGCFDRSNGLASARGPTATPHSLRTAPNTTK